MILDMLTGRSCAPGPTWVATGVAEYGSVGSATGRQHGVPAVSDVRKHIKKTIEERGHLILDEPVQLASGDWSRHFIDAKRALARGSDLKLAAEAMCELAAEMNVEFDAVGGLTMGADQFAHAVAMVADVEWFAVRTQAKERGTRRRIEGAVLGEGRRVFLVDDVVTRGGSILDALAAVKETGATVVAASCLVDRGDFGEENFRREGIPYQPLLTYKDFGIPPVGHEPGATAATG